MQNLKETQSNRSTKRFRKYGLIIALIMMVGSVTAMLLTSYGTLTGVADVRQAVILEGNNCDDNNVCTYDISDSPTATAGNSYRDGLFVVKNRAEIPATIELGTRCRNTAGFDDGTPTDMNIDWSTFGNNKCDGIVTSYFGSLNLTKKNTTTWQPIGEPIQITYTLVGSDFVINEAPPTNHVFVYAMDKENRFQNYATVMRVEDVNESLPMTGDWNADASPDYCDNNNGKGDYYTHCVGAKIWAVPESAIGSCVDDVCTLTWSGMANYYWETDLITYTKGTDNEMVLPANGGGFSFEIWNGLAIDLVSDNYTLTTNLVPVV